MIKNLTIKTRLIFVLAFLCLQLVIGALIGIVSLNLAQGAMDSMYHDRVVPLAQLDKVVRLLIRNQLLVATALTADAGEIDALVNEIDENIQTVGKTWQAYAETRMTDDEAAMAKRFAADRVVFVNEGLLPAAKALRARDMDTARAISQGAMKRLFAPVRDGINGLIKMQMDVAKADFNKAQDRYELVRAACIAGVIFCLLLAVVVGVLLVRAIVRPIDKAVALAEAVAGGDLTQEIDTSARDETGRLMRALKDMNDGLVRIVSQVRQGTDSIATASGQIAAGNLDLSSRTEQQASSLEETASSMEQLTSTVRQNAGNSMQANTLAHTASEVAQKGGTVVSEVVTTMESINASSRKIVDIISVIDGIAFQTNILALNAAVEAARAGEQGRGFAVVAAEVRTLAQRSANAAKEIKQLIDASVENVDNGTRLVHDAGATMRDIVDRVRQVTDIMSEISAASQEQNDGIEQINLAITEMEEVTQQNASLVEEAAAASQSLQDQAGALAELVSIFKLHAGTTTARVQAAPARKPQSAATATSLRQAPKRAQPKALQDTSAKPVPRKAAVGDDGDWESF